MRAKSIHAFLFHTNFAKHKSQTCVSECLYIFYAVINNYWTTCVYFWYAFICTIKFIGNSSVLLIQFEHTLIHSLFFFAGVSRIAIYSHTNKQIWKFFHIKWKNDAYNLLASAAACLFVQFFVCSSDSLLHSINWFLLDGRLL